MKEVVTARITAAAFGFHRGGFHGNHYLICTRPRRKALRTARTKVAGPGTMLLRLTGAPWPPSLKKRRISLAHDESVQRLGKGVGLLREVKSTTPKPANGPFQGWEGNSGEAEAAALNLNP